MPADFIPDSYQNRLTWLDDEIGQPSAIVTAVFGA